MKCTECNGRGHFLLPLSTPTCDVCGGTGEVAATLRKQARVDSDATETIVTKAQEAVTSSMDSLHRKVAEAVNPSPVRTPVKAVVRGSGVGITNAWVGFQVDSVIEWEKGDRLRLEFGPYAVGPGTERYGRTMAQAAFAPAEAPE